MKFINHLLTAFSVAIVLCSCSNSKNVVYMRDANKLPQSAWNKANPAAEPLASPGDMIQITVSSRIPEVVKPYNKSSYLSELGSAASSSSDGNSLEYYLVDNQGNIEFPVIGQINILGKNKAEIKQIVIDHLYPKHLTEVPAVEVRFRNFQVTMLGEVGSPGIISVPNEHLNILEAIARAGDLTIHGVRDKVRIIRTAPDGTRTIHTVNLNDKNLVMSPYFNLQQNDVIYVEPNGSKQRSSWSVPPGLSLTMSSVGTLIGIATFIITLTKL
ncbi:MAG: polysaccharide biosynthesis/export family protein [Muribaculaceae bacterium]